MVKIIESNTALLSHFGGLIFNSKEYTQLNHKRNLVNFSLYNQQQAMLSLSFDIMDFRAVSLLACPYGGMDVFDKVDNESIVLFIKKVKQTLSGYGVKRIEIKNAPIFISHKWGFDHENVLKSNNFELLDSEINHHIELNKGNHIHKMERRKIKKCMDSKFNFKPEKPESLDEVYDFLKKCRSQQGLTINITFDELNRLFEKLPDHYDAFTIRNQEREITAATIVVKINKEVVYNYLPAFDRAYKSFSPLAFLTYHLASFYQSLGFEHLDLGISSINGNPQTGLINFKERMGAVCTLRNNYQLILSE